MSGRWAGRNRSPVVRSMRLCDITRLATSMRWVRGTPLTLPEEPLVKRRAASASGVGVSGRWSRPAICSGVSMRSSMRHRLRRLPLISASSCSMKMRSRAGGQGNPCNLVTKRSSVMKREIPAFFTTSRNTGAGALKVMLTGEMPDRMQATLAMVASLPGGRMMPSRRWVVCLFSRRERRKAYTSKS